MTSQPKPHFRARIRIFSPDDGGPINGFFGFPESGIRNVPIGFGESLELGTIAIRYTPNSRIPGGEEFAADCSVISEDWFSPRVETGAKFFIWDGRPIATGIIEAIHWDAWAGP
jgi:hypothetical protein